MNPLSLLSGAGTPGFQYGTSANTGPTLSSAANGNQYGGSPVTTLIQNSPPVGYNLGTVGILVCVAAAVFGIFLIIKR